MCLWQIPWFSGIPKKHIHWTPGPKKSILIELGAPKKHIHWTPGPKKAYPVANPLVFWYPKKAYPLDSGPQKSISIELRPPKKHIHWTPGPKKGPSGRRTEWSEGEHDEPRKVRYSVGIGSPGSLVVSCRSTRLVSHPPRSCHSVLSVHSVPSLGG